MREKNTRVGGSDGCCFEHAEYTRHVHTECTQRAHHVLLQVTTLPQQRPEHNPCSTWGTGYGGNCPPWKHGSRAGNSHFMVFTATFWEVPSSCFRLPSITDPNSPVEGNNVRVMLGRRPSWPQECRTVWSWGDSAADTGQGLLRHLRSRVNTGVVSLSGQTSLSLPLRQPPQLTQETYRETWKYYWRSQNWFVFPPAPPRARDRALRAWYTLGEHSTSELHSQPKAQTW